MLLHATTAIINLSDMIVLNSIQVSYRINTLILHLSYGMYCFTILCLVLKEMLKQNSLYVCYEFNHVFMCDNI